jgi:DNA modification methylase
MTRKSEPKVINVKDKYKNLIPTYIRVLAELINKHPVEKTLEYGNLVNFKTNQSIPKHSWFDYKQGYSARLVMKILQDDDPSKNMFILDPFVGVGTTSVVAQSLGYKSIGFDINPVATFAAQVKTTYYSEADQDEVKRRIENFKPCLTKKVPCSSLLETSFNPDVFKRLMEIKGYYENILNPKVSSFFKLAYLAILEDCSIRIKDGNGIKIKINKEYIRDVYNYYLTKARKMLADLKIHNENIESITINGSMLNEEDFCKIKNHRIGEVIFSPPYANCFDYCEVYKLEIWMGDFVKEYSDFKRYRNKAIRSHVNASFDHAIKNENIQVDTIANIISCFNVWNKNIPDMIRGYFDDMTETLKRLKMLMIDNSKCYIVVANSGYKGVIVPTDLLLADIAGLLGFKVKSIVYARKIRASSQQMKELHNSYENIMRESIVILEKRAE